MSTPNEYEAFQLLTDALQQASSAAKLLAYYRPEQSLQWEKMAEVYQVSRQACFHLAGDGVTGKH